MRLLDYLLAERGRATKLAAAIGVNPVMVHQWAYAVKPVPVARCAQVERATDGVVTRRDLRADFRMHWPELESQPAPTTPRKQKTPHTPTVAAPPSRRNGSRASHVPALHPTE